MHGFLNLNVFLYRNMYTRIFVFIVTNEGFQRVVWSTENDQNPLLVL